MNSLPRKILCELVGRYGPTVADDPTRLKSLLLDLCGAHRREIILLVNAAKEQVAKDLQERSKSLPRQLLLQNLTKRLEDHLAVTEKAARWAVDSWGLALGVISHQDIDPLEIESEKRTIQVPLAPPALPPAPPLPVAGKPRKKWRVAGVVLACLILCLAGLFVLNQEFFKRHSSPIGRKKAETQETQKQRQEPLPVKTSSPKPDMTVMGILSWYEQKKTTFFCIEPWVVCKDNSYSSIYINEINEAPDKKVTLQRRRRALGLPGPTFWLYDRGVEIGTFEVQGGDVAGDQPTWTGKVSWKGKTLSKQEVSDRRVIALSRPIPQNFWLSQDRLSPEQLSGFKQLISATLTRTPKVFKEGVGPDAAQRSVGKITEKTFLVMDLDQDGQPEVFGELKCDGKPCTMMVADVFATWQGRWNVLRQATYWAYCPQAEAVGDPHFEVIPVDLNGDGRAEVFIRYGFYETWGNSLFLYQGGRLIKKLEFGEGGV